MRYLRMCMITLLLLVRIVSLLGRRVLRLLKKQWAKRDMIQLRDAMTGQKLGMTKAQYRRYILALGTKDHKQIIKACNEVQQRRVAMQ